EAVEQAHLPQIAQVAGERALTDRDDPEALGTRERGQHPAFGDAEHRPAGAFAAQMQPRIAVTGDDERVGTIVCLDQPAQRERFASPSARRSRTFLFATSACVSMPRGPSASVAHPISGPSANRSGSRAASMPLVTASFELVLTTRMRARFSAMRRFYFDPARQAKTLQVRTFELSSGSLPFATLRQPAELYVIG